MDEFKAEQVINGFVIPDFDFDSSDAIIPISTPSLEPYYYDLVSIFFQIHEAYDAENAEMVKHWLTIFQGGLLNYHEKHENLPEELYNNNVAEFLLELTNIEDVLDSALSTMSTWLAVQDIDFTIIVIDDFIKKLIDLSICALSDINFHGNVHAGKSAITVLKNLLFRSNDARSIFIENNGIDLFCTLYDEVREYPVKQVLLWTVQNSMLLNPPQQIEKYDDVLNFMRYTFGLGLKTAEAAEINLARAYISMGPDFASRFMKTYPLETTSELFNTADEFTRIQLLYLFNDLLYNFNEAISTMATSSIKWNTVFEEMKDTQPKLQKSLCISSTAAFKNGGVPFKKMIQSELIPTLFCLLDSSKSSVRQRALEALLAALQTKSVEVINIIIGNKFVLEKLSNFLESDWIALLSMAIEFMLFIVTYAQRGYKQQEILDAFYEYGIFDLMETVCSKELPENLSMMSNLLHERLIELADSPIVDFPEYSEYSDEEENQEETNLPQFGSSANYNINKIEQTEEAPQQQISSEYDDEDTDNDEEGWEDA